MWLKEGRFIEPIIVGDVYHISKRVITTVSSEKKPLLGFFASDLRKCFGSSTPGVLWLGEKIMSAIEAVKLKYEREDIALWRNKITMSFENEMLRECTSRYTFFSPSITLYHNKLTSILHNFTKNRENLLQGSEG